MSASYTYTAAPGTRIQPAQSYSSAQSTYAPVQYRTAYQPQPPATTVAPQIISYNRAPTANSPPPAYGVPSTISYGQPQTSYAPTTTQNTYGAPTKMTVLPSQPPPIPPSQAPYQPQPIRFMGPTMEQFTPQAQPQSQPPPPLFTHHQMPKHISQPQPPQAPPPPNMSLLQQHLRPVAPPSAAQMGLPNLEYIVAPSSARERPVKATPASLPQPQGYTFSRASPSVPTALPPPTYHQVPAMPPQHDDTGAYKPIAVGDRLPPAHIDLHGVCVNLQEFFKNRNGIIFGLVGAFNPVDTDKAVPAILQAQEHFERLVDFVGCLVVNDPFVVKAWAKKLGVVDQFTFIADSDAKFTKVLGMAQYLPAEGLGIRSRRFAAVVGPRAKIRWIGFDDDSLADNVLLHLPRFVRTPWKSFLVGVGYNAPDEDEDVRVREDTVNNLQSVRSLLASQGFCSEPDWQLLLCDKMMDVFTPTRDNILNGLRWVVEGAQAGDVLCFYFAGRGGRFINEDGTETSGLLPMDHETAGPIDEWEIYETLAPHVPESCRLTIILDIHNDEPVHCPMPYVYSSKVSVVSSGDMEAQILSSESIQWRERCGGDPKLRGEIIVISLHGHTPVPPGCLSSLLTSVCVPEERREEFDQPLTYADQMDRMQVQLVEWQAEKTVQLATSRPLKLNEEFTLADVLP